MKNKFLIPIIIGSILLVAGGVVLAVGIKNYEDTPMQSKTIELNAETFNNFSFNMSTSDVEFKVSADGSKKVVLSELNKEYHEVKVENNTLYIKQIEELSWKDRTFNFHFKNLKAEVYLPSGEYGEVTAVTSTGDVRLPKDFTFSKFTVTGSTADIYCSSNVTDEINIVLSTGDITLSDMNCGSYTSKTSTGDVIMNKVNVAGNVSLESTTGEVTLKQVSCAELSQKSSTGDVELKNTVIAGHLKLETSTGDIEFIDSDANTINIKTTTGDVEGTLLSSKVFYVVTDTGDVDVPHSTTGGLCEITTDTGDVELKIK